MKKPNILYVFCDEFRRQAIGCMGEDPVYTPNFDEFARESVVFKQAVSNYPVCSPYRGILFTGLYPHENHITTNCTSKSALTGCYLRDDQVCLSDILAASGYETGYIGKWHLDAPSEAQSQYTEGPRGDGLIWDAYTPPGRGRHGFHFWHSYGCYDQHMHPHYWEGEGGMEDRIDVDEWSVAHETRVAIDFIKKQENPFALFLSYNPPHMGFDLFPQEYLRYYEGKEASDLLARPNAKPVPEAVAHVKDYFSSITGIDENFGRLMDALKEQGIYDDTIVIFTSDHGEMMGSHGLMYKNIWYEEAMGVPFLVRWPGRLSHQETDAQLSSIDIMPTVLGMAGLETRIPDGCHGHNFAPDMENGDYQNGPSASLYILEASPENRARGIRDARYTFVAAFTTEKLEFFLYDREKDPYQLHNTAGEDRETVRHYLSQLKEKLGETEDPFLKILNTAMHSCV